MLRAELAYELVATERFAGPECSPADVLHLVVRHAQRLCNRTISGILVRSRRGLHAPEPEQQHRLAQLSLMLLGQFQETPNLLHH